MSEFTYMPDEPQADASVYDINIMLSNAAAELNVINTELHAQLRDRDRKIKELTDKMSDVRPRFDAQLEAATALSRDLREQLAAAETRLRDTADALQARTNMLNSVVAHSYHEGFMNHILPSIISAYSTSWRASCGYILITVGTIAETGHQYGIRIIVRADRVYFGAYYNDMCFHHMHFPCTGRDIAPARRDCVKIVMMELSADISLLRAIMTADLVRRTPLVGVTRHDFRQ